MSALLIRCDYCGARARSRCKTPNDLDCAPHASRKNAWRRRQMSLAWKPARASRDDNANICPFDAFIKNDAPHLDAWRVRVLAACIVRSGNQRGANAAQDLLAEFSSPVRLALARRREILEKLCAHGLDRSEWRARLIHDASTAGAHGLVLDDEHDTRYSHQAVSIFVLKDPSVRPSDRGLSRARTRLMESL